MNAAQFELAVRSYGPILARTLFQLTGGRRQDAEDLLQRTFERAWARREERRTEALGAWLRGIARLEYLMYLRGQHRYLRLQGAVKCDLLAHLPWDAPGADIDARALTLCLERLDATDRQIVDLFYGRGEQDTLLRQAHTDPEVAGILSGERGTPWAPDRVRKRRNRALGQLNECLERAGRKET